MNNCGRPSFHTRYTWIVLPSFVVKSTFSHSENANTPMVIAMYDFKIARDKYNKFLIKNMCDHKVEQWIDMRFSFLFNINLNSMKILK